MYHGHPDHRAELRATRLQPPSKDDIGSDKRTGRKSATSGNSTSTFPVVVTTYEICMRDQKYLSNFKWKFIVVDEGHRLKNFDCRYVQDGI
jgi:ATP-dependent DNA helicase